MNHWSAVKALVYKEMRLSQLETLACFAAWPIIIGVFSLTQAVNGTLGESQPWNDLAEVAPPLGCTVCVGAVILFGLRELLSDATTREPLFFHTLPPARRTYWGIKVAYGLARYLAVTAVGLLFSWGLLWRFDNVPQGAKENWAGFACLELCLILWYMACFLATVRVESHWLWRVAIVLGGLGLSLVTFAVFVELGQRLIWQAVLVGVPIFVVVWLMYQFAILHVVRFRDFS